MEFKKFENKNHYLEYLLIYLYSLLELDKNTAVELNNYKSFELTDNIIISYNKWVENSGYLNSKVIEWINNNPDQVEYFKRNFHSTFKPKVAIWSDRNKTNYYKNKLQDSFIFENYIAELISEKYGLDLGQYLTPAGQYELGENALGIEIKNDTLIKKYGNVYIECQEKARSENYSYINSGILKEDNCEYFLIGTKEEFYIFRKALLKEILFEEIENMKKGIKSSRNIKFKRISTSKGFVYPVQNAINNTISMDQMIKEVKLKK